MPTSQLSEQVAVTVGGSPVSSISLIAPPGVLILTGRVGDGTADNPYMPVAWRSIDGGLHWTVESVPPPTDDQYALGVVPDLSIVLWGTTHKSLDDLQTWESD